MIFFNCIDIPRSPFMRNAKCIIMFYTKSGCKIKQYNASNNMKILGY